MAQSTSKSSDAQGMAGTAHFRPKPSNSLKGKQRGDDDTCTAGKFHFVTLQYLQPDIDSPKGKIGTPEENLYLGLNSEVVQNFWADKDDDDEGSKEASNSKLQIFRSVVNQIVKHRSRAVGLRMSVDSWRHDEEWGAGDHPTLSNKEGHANRRQKQVREFWCKYRSNCTRQEIPLGQILPAVDGEAALLSTACQFWRKAASAARMPPSEPLGFLPPLRAVAPEAPVLGRKPLSVKWEARAMQESHRVGKTRWPLAEKFREPEPISNRAALPAIFDGRGRPGSKSTPALGSVLSPKELRSVGECFSPSKKGFNFGAGNRGAGLNSSSLPNLHGASVSCGSRTSKNLKAAALDCTPSSSESGKLPPLLATTFMEGWKKNEPKPSKEKSTSMSRYMTACQHSGILPTPLEFLTGSSLLNAENYALVDSDLLAVAAMLRMSEVHEVDLTGNTLLTDKAFVPFLAKLHRKPASVTLQRLSLRRCSHAGQGAIEQIVSLLSEPTGVTQLRHLDLSGVPISMRFHLSISKAVGEHPSLESLSLAETGMGSNPNARQCLDYILNSTSLKALDLGWNCFGELLFLLIGTRLADSNVNLASLSVANCSATSHKQVALPKGAGTHCPAGKPANIMFEHLSQDCALTRLDVSLNSLDLTSALVLEDALTTHPGLTELDVSNNPLGFFGARSIIRLFANPKSRLKKLYCVDSLGKTDVACSEQVFRMSSPEGVFDLDMTRPYHRSLFRMCLKVCVKTEGLKVASALNNFSCTTSYSLPAKPGIECGREAWPVPSEGQVKFTLSTTAASKCDPLKEESRADIEYMLDQHVEGTRMKVGFNKIVPVMALFQQHAGKEEDQKLLLDVLAKDFWLEYLHVEQLCGEKSLRLECVSRLCHCVAGGRMSRHLCTLLLPRKSDFLRCREKLANWMEFTPCNPTTHYKLDLGNAGDFHVADCLRILDRWETASVRRRGLPDTSRRGNYSQIRNERWEHRAIECISVADWDMPETGILELDYVGGLRPNPGATPIRDCHFRAIINYLLDSRCSPGQQRAALRQVGTSLWLSSLQLRELLGCVYDKEVRLQLFAVFLFRLTDVWNLKVCRARFTSQEYKILAHRLGAVNLFPYIQPEQTKFNYKFHVNDQRIAASIFCLLCEKEKGQLQEPIYIKEDGTHDILPNGVPRSWSSMDGCPKGGSFSAIYITAPETRSLAARRDFLETYGRWKISPRLKVEDVLWWSTLSETPDDVIRFLEVIAKQHTLEEAFRVIDGKGGNGVISFKEFAEFMETLHCKRLEGPEKRKRWAAIFRYLDPTQEGTISIQEWSILETVSRELDKQTDELNIFLKHRFGGHKQAWAVLDENSDGEMTQDEWDIGLAKAGYMGASRELFFCLDQND
ncbi:unnamed protein product, partial [Polarella glacialis]